VQKQCEYSALTSIRAQASDSSTVLQPSSTPGSK